MTISYLDAFFAVAETLSFSKASKRLSISQPAISRQIRLLEDDLGQSLFVRDKHHVSLTAAGVSFREHVLPAYTTLLSGIKQTKVQAQEIAGPIRIGCLREAGPFVELAMAFQKDYPQVVFQFDFLDNYEIFTAMRDGQLEFGITTVASDNETMQSFNLYTQDSIVVTRGGNERDIAEFTPQELIPFVRYRVPTPLHHDTESFFGSFLKKYRKELGRLKPEVKFAVNSHRSMAEVLSGNDFYAVMPLYFVRKFIRYGRLRRVGDYVINKKIYLTHASTPHFETRYKLFKSYLIEECRKIQRL